MAIGAISKTPLLHQQKEVEECGICLELLDKNDVFAHDKIHRFHAECLNKWVETHPSCPSCRTPITYQKEYYSLTLENVKKAAIKFFTTIVVTATIGGVFGFIFGGPPGAALGAIALGSLGVICGAILARDCLRAK